MFKDVPVLNQSFQGLKSILKLTQLKIFHITPVLYKSDVRYVTIYTHFF